MKSMIGIFILIVFGLLPVSGKAKMSFQQDEKNWRPGTVVIKIKSFNTSQKINRPNHEISSLLNKYNATSIEPLVKNSNSSSLLGREELNRIFIVRFDKSANLSLKIDELSRDPMIDYAEPDYILKSHSIPNDPLLNQIYPLSIIDADSAWSIQQGDSNVIIGIIDTGVDWDHPDLSASIWTNKNEIPENNIDDDNNGFIDDIRGWDFLENGIDAFQGEDSSMQDNNPMDFDGHGTHVAGIAAGTTNNGIGISSLGRGCRIMPLRIGWHTKDGNGAGFSSDMAKAFVYAVENGASICNLSYGTSGAVLDAALFAYKNGVLIVNSAGNSHSDEPSVLGSQSWALSVAATNSEDKKASYSTFHSTVDVSAPGGDFSSGNSTGFLSTIVHPSNFYQNNEYVPFQGTSMASPLVAALAGLIKSQHKNWSPAKIMFQIVETADNIDNINPKYSHKLGSGRINAVRALTEIVVAKPKMKIASVRIDDSNSGNNNGLLDPGESVSLHCLLKNEWGDAHNTTGIISCSNGDISIIKSNSNYGTVYGISNLDSSEHGSIDDGFQISISPNALPQTFSFTLNISTAEGITEQLPFDVRLHSNLLFVDDDDGETNIQQYYINTFNQLGVSYDTWNRKSQDAIPFDYLQKYKAVIWSCEWSFPSLDITDRNLLATYLNNGGSLFISGQDIGWDLADSAGNEFILSNGASKLFYENYLKSKYITDDAKNDSLYGISENFISNNLNIARNQPGRTSSDQYPDVIDTINGSKYCFVYNGGDFKGKGGAIIYSKDYTVVNFGFGGFESIVDMTQRKTIMQRVIKFLSPEIKMTKVIDETPVPSASSFSIEQNYPNPFNPTTMINYQIPFTSRVSIKLYDLLGRELITLVNSSMNAGKHSIPFNASELPSGIYFYRIESTSVTGTNSYFTETKKMVFLK